MKHNASNRYNDVTVSILQSLNSYLHDVLLPTPLIGYVGQRSSYLFTSFHNSHNYLCMSCDKFLLSETTENCDPELMKEYYSISTFILATLEVLPTKQNSERLHILKAGSM
jgi:hypothetical protein